jgi:hypothetical protein
MNPLLPILVATATAAAPLDLAACQNRLDACWSRVVVLQAARPSSDGEIVRPGPEPFDPVPVIAGAAVGTLAGFCLGYLMYSLTDGGKR